MVASKVSGSQLQLDVAKLLLSAKLKTIPGIYAPLARLREGSKKRMVRRTTDIVIEGYWRCGNHFATYAFLVAQGKPMEVAHHFHAPAQLMLAVRWGVPAVLLIREPLEAIASATVYLEKDDPRGFLKFYNTFHAPLVSLAPRLVVSDFPRTVGDFGSVIAAVNQKFGRDFAPFSHMPENCARVEEMIHDEHTQNMGSNAATLPLPSAEKATLKGRVMDALTSPPCASLLAEAQRLYAALKNYAL